MAAALPNRRRGDPTDSEAHAHRRKTDENAMLHLHSRVADCEESIQKLLESQQHMTENLKKLTDNTGRLADVLEAWQNVKGFWWTLRMMSSGAKIVVPLIAVIAAAWLFLKTGNWEVKL
jgi:hypothetical protein